VRYTRAPSPNPEPESISMAEANALREQIKDLQGRLDDLRGYL
jgi:hypothetical protein